MIERPAIVDLALVTLALAGGVALAVFGDAPTASEVLAREDNVFPWFRADEIVRIEITRPDVRGARVVLRKKPNDDDPHAFFLGEGSNPEAGFVADTASVADLVRSLDFATWQRRFGASEATGATFDAPTLELSIQFRGGRADLKVGGSVEHDGKIVAYAASVRADGADPRVGRVRAEWVEQLLVEQRTFRGRLLLPYAKSELARLRLERAGRHVELVRDDSGFRVGEQGPRGDREAIDHVLFQLARSNLDGFLDDDAARKILEADPDALVVTEIPMQGEAVSVRFGGSCPNRNGFVVAQRVSPDVLTGCVPAALLPALRVDADGLTSKTIAPFSPDEVDHAVVRGPLGSLDLLRRDGAFELTGENARPVALEPGNEFLRALVSTKGEISSSAPPTRPPDGTGWFVAAALDTTVRSSFRFWVDDETALVERDDDHARLTFPRSSAWFLTGDSSWSRDKEIAHYSADELARVVIDDRGRETVLERNPETESASFRLTRPAGFRLDPRLSAQLLRTLEHVTVVRFAPEEKKPTARAELSLELVPSTRERKSLRLEVGPRTRGGFLAWSDALDVPFVVPADFVRTLRTALVDRQALLLDPASIDSLRVEAPGVTYSFERRGDEFVSTGVPAAHLGLVLGELLRGIEPLAAVHIGPARAEEGLEEPFLRLRGTRKNEKGDREPFEIRIGHPTLHEDTHAHFARVSGVDATFAVDRRGVLSLVDLL